MPNANPWQSRIWREHAAGTLTRAFRDVLLTLRTFRGHGGLICPSHETLADRAKASISTVARALKHARHLGLVEWSERRVKAGWRWLRTSNTYELMVPDSPVDPQMRPVWWRRLTTGQSDRGGNQEEKQGRKAALRKMLAEAACLPDLLARRRMVIEGRLNNKFAQFR